MFLCERTNRSPFFQNLRKSSRMKILTLLLATAALTFASCAGTPPPKKTASCCASGTGAKCPSNDPNCKAPQHKHKAS